MTQLAIRYVPRRVHRAAVLAWHSHLAPAVGETLALGAHVGETLVGVVVLGRPALGLDDGLTWDVTRLAVGPEAPRYTASRLLGAAGRATDVLGISRVVSYTRIDEPGTCYRAAGWRPVALVNGRAHDTGNRALRWLPGLYVPTTEVIDRVRWERGASSDRVRAKWNGERWESL